MMSKDDTHMARHHSGNGYGGNGSKYTNTAMWLQTFLFLVVAGMLTALWMNVAGNQAMWSDKYDDLSRRFTDYAAANNSAIAALTSQVNQNSAQLNSTRDLDRVIIRQDRLEDRVLSLERTRRIDQE